MILNVLASPGWERSSSSIHYCLPDPIVIGEFFSHVTMLLGKEASKEPPKASGVQAWIKNAVNWLTCWCNVKGKYMISFLN